MGSWKLEVFRMALYISFPVGLFYVFNQPQYFEKWVIETRRQLYPPQDEERRQKFKDQLERNRRLRQERDLLDKLENFKES